MTIYTADSSSNSQPNQTNHSELAIKLRNLLPFFQGTHTRNFINSLIDWNQGKGRDYTPKQLVYVLQYIEAGEKHKAECNAKQLPTETKQPRKFPNIAKLFLYSKQVASLAYPKITYQLSANAPAITFYYNNNHACIQAKVGGKLIATIRANGQEDIRWPIKEVYLPMLEQIEKDPIAAATLSGKLTSCCSFCSKQLTDERSVVLGYGPVCADHWGLPWDVKRTGSTTVTEEL